MPMTDAEFYGNEYNIENVIQFTMTIQDMNADQLRKMILRALEKHQSFDIFDFDCMKSQVRKHFEFNDGNKVATIKYLRGETGWSLKESKEYVEEVCADMIALNRL